MRRPRSLARLACALLLSGAASHAQTPRPSMEDLQSRIDALQTVVVDPDGPRFRDCGDGTVADRQTGLQWEKKTGTLGAVVFCESTPCPDPHDVNNAYAWSGTGTDPDGGAFSDFLARLNGRFDPDAATGCFADRCDWRLPKISELQTIMIGPEAAPGQASTCPGFPCLDPDFTAIAGPSTFTNYWSETPVPGSPTFAFVADHSPGGSGVVLVGLKTQDLTFVRAVRSGGCD